MCHNAPDGGGEGFEVLSPNAEGVEGDVKWEGWFPLRNRLGRLVERRELLQRGPGPSPGRKQISMHYKRHRMPLV